MATGSGSISWNAAGGNTYTATVSYSVSWTSGSTLRSSSPASGSVWGGGTTFNCGTYLTLTINCSEKLSNGTYNYFSFDISGTAPACPVATTPTFTDSSVANGRKGISYTDGVSANNTTSYSINYVSGALSSLGLSFNTANGAITGTPNAIGSTTFTVTATNAPGNNYTPASATTSNLTITIINSTPKVWNGSQWVYATDVKIWNGTSWVSGKIQSWNGTNWADPA